MSVVADDAPARQGPGAGRLRALVVVGDQPVAGLIAGHLEHEDFSVVVRHTGSEALRAIRDTDPDAILLNLTLPGHDGLDVCRQLREATDAYIVALCGDVHQMAAESEGADACITTPFDPIELGTRLGDLLRRPARCRNSGSGGAKPVRVFGALRIDVAARGVQLRRVSVALTRTEFEVLATLSSRPSVVFTRRELVDAVWGPSWDGNVGGIDVHVGHLRRKLGDDPDDPRYVLTVRGVGYRMGRGR